MEAKQDGNEGPVQAQPLVGQTSNHLEFKALHTGFHGRKKDSLCHSERERGERLVVLG